MSRITKEFRKAMAEKFGDEAVEVTAELVSFLFDMTEADPANVPLMKAGFARMAEIANEILPQLNKQGRSRSYGHQDLNGTLGDLPPDLQDIFVGLVGTLMLQSKGGPTETAWVLSDGLDEIERATRQSP